MSCTLWDLNSLNILQGGSYSVSFMQWLTCQGCHPHSLIMGCVPCALLDHGTHDPLLDIPKQSLLLVIDTFWYQVQLLVPAGVFTHAIPYKILAYHFWHFYACHLPLVSQGNWVSFYSTLLLLPSGCFPGLVLLSVKLSRSLSDCQDSHLIQDWFPTAPPTLFWPTPETSGRSLRTPNDLQEPQSYFCLHLSSSFCFIRLELQSCFHFPSQFSPFHFSIY